MDRDVLIAFLREGASLESIAKAMGKHPSSVSYWLKRYGLQANGATTHRPRGALQEAELEALIEEGLNVREIAARLDRSQRTVRYWIEKYGLPSPIAARRRMVDEARAAGRRTLVKTCPRHGETTFVIENSGRTRCRRCRQEAVVRWRRRVKLQLVAEMGGCCRICGYDAYSGALEFHHLNPAEKSHGLAAHGVTRSLDEMRREAKKCVLLCANCHAEVEAGVVELPLEYAS